MDFFSVKETFTNMFPDKLKTFTFDDKCIRKMEIILTDGLPNLQHHVEYDKIKVSIEGIPDQYVKIAPHRDMIYWKDHKSFIMSKNEIYIHPDHVKNLKDLKENKSENYDIALSEFCMWSAMSKEDVEKNIS